MLATSVNDAGLFRDEAAAGAEADDAGAAAAEAGALTFFGSFSLSSFADTKPFTVFSAEEEASGGEDARIEDVLEEEVDFTILSPLDIAVPAQVSEFENRGRGNASRWEAVGH
jgi:hypothetical protein